MLPTRDMTVPLFCFALRGHFLLCPPPLQFVPLYLLIGMTSAKPSSSYRITSERSTWTRLPGELVADAYLEWLQRHADTAAGTMLVAESDSAFVAFVVGWIEVADIITETPDSNRFGYVSDLCVVPAFRGQRIAEQLLTAIERHFRQAGVVRIRINALAANRSARVSYERAGYAPYEVLHEKVLEPECAQ